MRSIHGRCVLVARKQTFNKEASDCVLGKTMQQYRLLEAAPPPASRPFSPAHGAAPGPPANPWPVSTPPHPPSGLSRRKGGRKRCRFQDELPSTSSLHLPLTRHRALGGGEGYKGNRSSSYDHSQAHNKRARLTWALDHVCACAPLRVSDGDRGTSGRKGPPGWLGLGAMAAHLPPPLGPPTGPC